VGLYDDSIFIIFGEAWGSIRPSKGVAVYWWVLPAEITLEASYSWICLLQ